MYPDVITHTSELLGIPVKVVETAYKSSWEFIRKTIENLPLASCDEEEFGKLRTNFNIPSLGKLYVTYDKIVGNRKRYEYIKTLMENDKIKKD